MQHAGFGFCPGGSPLPLTSGSSPFPFPLCLAGLNAGPACPPPALPSSALSSNVPTGGLPWPLEHHCPPGFSRELWGLRPRPPHQQLESWSAQFLSSLFEAIFLQCSSRDGLFLDLHCMGPREEAIGYFLTRYHSHVNKSRHRPLQPGVSQ